MRFRFTLSNDVLGSQVLTKEPMGWETMEVLLKRGTDTHGFFYEQVVNLSFYCGAGKEFIDQVREEQGIDAIININIQIACQSCDLGQEVPDYTIDYSDDYGSQINGNCVFEEFYTGILDMKTWQGSKNFTNINIIESSFFQKVRNRLDTVVDLLSTKTIDGTTIGNYTFGPYDLNLHSKAILAVGEVDMLGGTYSENFLTDPSGPATVFMTAPFDTIILAEFETFNTPSPSLITSISGIPQVQHIYSNTTGESLDITFDYIFNGNILETLPYNRSYTDLQLIYRISNNDDPSSGGAITIQSFGAKSPLGNTLMVQPVNLSGTISTTIPAGHFLQVYIVFANYTGNNPANPLQSTFGWEMTEMSITVTAISITGDSTGKAFAIFEAGAKISNVISDQADSFRSSYLGRTNSEPFAYPLNGCGSFSSLLSGFWVRGFPITGEFARTTKMSMNTYFKSLAAIHNLGLGIEKIDDINYIVIERMNYFYDSSTVLLTFNNVPDLLITEAENYYFARVNVGYNKWETEFRNGLEEPNSKRFYDLGIKAVETEKTFYSDFVGGGYPLEEARRQQFTETLSTDTEWDEENFIVCLNRSVDGSNIPTDLDVAEKDENFVQVNNLLSPETAYNLRISSSRNYLRHSDIINPVLLKYPSREAKFMGGEGNYKMESEFTNDSCPGRWNNNLLNEGQNIQWDDLDNTDNSPLWIPEIATFKYPISFTNFNTLRNNPKGVIMVSETDTGHIPYYILEVKYVPANGGLADFKLLRAYQA